MGIIRIFIGRSRKVASDFLAVCDAGGGKIFCCLLLHTIILRDFIAR